MATTYYFLPTRNLFGEDSVKETGSLMQSLGGKKALIVTDAFLAKNGMAENIQTILSDAGVESTVFGGVEPNPKDVNVIRSSPSAVVPPTTVRRRSPWLPQTEETSEITKVSTAPAIRYAR